MALQVEFLPSLTLNDKYAPTIMRFTDTTGAYDVDTNPGGYGSPNPTYSDVADVSIRLQSYDGNFDCAITSADIDGWTPTSLVPYVDIPASVFGIDVYEDMDYVITYSVYDSDPTLLSDKTDNAFFKGQTYGNIINNLLKCRPDTNILNPDEYVDAICRTNALMLGAQAAFEDGAYPASDEGIKRIKTISDNLINFY